MEAMIDIIPHMIGNRKMIKTIRTEHNPLSLYPRSTMVFIVDDREHHMIISQIDLRYRAMFVDSEAIRMTLLHPLDEFFTDQGTISDSFLTRQDSDKLIRISLEMMADLLCRQSIEKPWITILPFLISRMILTDKDSIEIIMRDLTGMFFVEMIFDLMIGTASCIADEAMDRRLEICMIDNLLQTISSISDSLLCVMSLPSPVLLYYLIE